jgi:1,2-diacylglycerol 3-alpha-glucosyltransferase
MARLLIHFARYGPYHHARLRAAHTVLAPLGWEVIGLEIAGTDATYVWDDCKSGADGPQVVTAFPDRIYEQITRFQYRQSLLPLLESLKPDVMAIAGWGSVDARQCSAWCRRKNVRRIVMSETRAADGRRVWWKEQWKRHLLSGFDGALVGGASHRDYLIQLGMRRDCIERGYNVVDDGYFAAEAERHKKAALSQQRPYFLASNRFIERKNLMRLVEAYASFSHQRSLKAPASPPWSLVLLGDGDQKPALMARARELGLEVVAAAPWEEDAKTTALTMHAGAMPMAASDRSQWLRPVVYFPGFRQIEELSRFYAHAGCFIHPAMEEPWGLVINEAMASGLPVLSSVNVGAAEELVDDGVNGWKFDPADTEALAALMLTLSTQRPESLEAMGAASRRILAERAPTAAFGRGLASLLTRVGESGWAFQTRLMSIL